MRVNVCVHCGSQCVRVNVCVHPGGKVRVITRESRERAFSRAFSLIYALIRVRA